MRRGIIRLSVSPLKDLIRGSALSFREANCNGGLTKLSVANRAFTMPQRPLAMK